MELGHDLLGEELERFADVLVTVVARLAHEDHLVDARRFVALQQHADLVGRADRPPQRAEALLHQLGPEGLTRARCDVAVEPEQRAVLLELVPDHRSSGSVLPEHVVVRERVPEEVATVETAVDCGRLVLVAHQGHDDREVGVHREAARHAFLRRERAVVVVHPLLRLGRLDERERERADALLRGEVDGLAPAAGDPHRRMRLLQRLRDNVAWRHLQEPAVVARERLLDEHARHRVERLVPLVALGGPVDVEAPQLGLRRGLAGAEVHPAVGHEVERGDALRDTSGVVEALR